MSDRIGWVEFVLFVLSLSLGHFTYQWFKADPEIDVAIMRSYFSFWGSFGLFIYVRYIRK